MEGLTELINVVRTEFRDGFGQLASRIDQTNARLDQTNARLDQTNAKLDQNNARLDRAVAGIDQLAVGLDEANSRIEQTNARLDQTSSKIDQTNSRLDQTVDYLGNHVVETRAGFKALTERLDRFETRVSKAFGELKTYFLKQDKAEDQQNDQLFDLKKRVTRLEKRVDDIDNDSPGPAQAS